MQVKLLTIQYCNTNNYVYHLNLLYLYLMYGREI